MAEKKVAFELVAPERLLASIEADMVVVPGAEGDFGVLPNHAPLMSLLRPGVIAVYQGDRVDQRLFVDGGFAEVNERGCTVLGGSASELEQDLPFWVFVDALDEYLAGVDPQLVASLPVEVRSELAHVMPSLADLASDGPPVVQDERYRAHRAVRDLLERLAVRGPLVLVLDDVHWADAASVELLTALLRSPPDAAVLVVMAARPRQRPERLVRALERADRHGDITHIGLTGLDRDAAGELLGEGVARARRDALYEEAGGNPFYLQQLARSHGTDGARSPSEAGALEAVGVPAAVIASLTEELALLSDGTLRVLRGAAVAGDPFETDLAAAAAGAEETATMEALDELL